MEETVWMTIACDGNGRIQARDAVEGVASEWYETVGVPSWEWPEIAASAIREAMDRAGTYR